ncbi:MAG: nucleotidyltransferase family protein [Prevotella sp.]|nr:nucleotidyltransferase family protein [Prevotella sp.]
MAKVIRRIWYSRRYGHSEQVSKDINIFLQLVRLGIGNPASPNTKSVNWQVVQAIAEKQGLYAIVLDGIERLPVALRPPQETLLEWIGEVLQDYEYRYDAYKRTIAEMAGFYNSHGLKMMVLKGYACSLNWPKPEHRPCGDIDIWQFGKQKEADFAITREKRIEVDKSHHHHTVFNWGDFTVENHYDFVNVYHHKSNAELEKIFKELGEDDTRNVKVNDADVYLPSPMLHTLFLLKHMMNDFTSFSVNLRQVLDWAFHIRKYGKEIDWCWMLDVIDKYHMKDFFNTINAICVEDLAFEASMFPHVQYNLFIKDKVFADIINPKFSFEEPINLISRLIYKYRRWKGNSWKHKLCYNESLWSAFWSGVWGHLLKPASI